MLAWQRRRKTTTAATAPVQQLAAIGQHIEFTTVGAVIYGTQSSHIGAVQNGLKADRTPWPSLIGRLQLRAALIGLLAGLF